MDIPYQEVEGKDCGDVCLCTLTTCGWCARTKRLLGDLGVKYRFVDVDRLGEAETEQVVKTLDAMNENWGFPAMLIDGSTLIIGFAEDKIRDHFGLHDECPVEKPSGGGADKRVADLVERFASAARKKGYNLNPDRDLTIRLITSLTVNQDRYGYWACPCRLASGKRDEDRDIICPCIYRDPDIEEYGSCYCALYVSDEIAGGQKKPGPVPERRPPGKRNR